MAAPAAVLSILVRANTGSATTGLLRINQQLDRTEAHSKKVAHAIEGVAKGFALVGGGAAAAGIAFAIKKAADFEQQMSSLGSVADATGKQMEQFRKQALKAGADTKFSALEAAKAQTELAKGGLSVKQIMKGGLKSALALAAAGELELADAASTTVNAMKLFGLRGKAAMKVADGFATAANRTTADVSDFALALQQGGSAAKTAGLSFQETITALEALAEVGVKGSDAGTSLKTALIQLASPSSAKAKETAKKLGIEVFDTTGKMKSLVDVSKNLQDSLSGLTQKQRIQAATTLVGQDGFRALLALYDAGPKKIAKMERELNKQGTAAEVARKKQDNLKGSLENLGGSVETLGIQVGTAMLPALRTASKELTRFANDVGKIVSRKDLSLGEKLQKSLDLAEVRAKPWIDKLEKAIDQANIPQKLADAISAATPVIVKAAAAGGLVAAKTFAGAFASSDIWGKLVLGGWLLSRMGGKAGFFKMGAVAGTSFGEGMAASGGAGGLGIVGKLKGVLGGLKGLAGRVVALDVGVNLVDSKGNLIATAINTAHDLTFGIVPKVKVPTGNERAQASIAGVSKELDTALKSRSLSGIEHVTDKIKEMASEARSFGRADLAGQLDKLASGGSSKLQKLSDSEHKAAGMSGRFADAIRGLRLKGSKDFDGLVHSVTFGSRQILRVGGKNSELTQQAISHQFDLARKRVQQAMDRKVVSVKRGTEILHNLAVKELGLYGISAGRVNVVLAKGANGQMRPNARGGFQTGGKPTGDSIPSLLERGEYVVNRKAVQKVGKHALDRLNFGAAPRFQKGGMAGGGSVTGDTDFLPQMMRALTALSAAAHRAIFVQSGRRTVAEQLAQGPSTPGHPVAGPNGPHVRGVAADITPGFSAFSRLAGRFGLGFTVMPQEPWHIQLLKSVPGLAGLASVANLPRPVLKGPASVALEAGQGALDRVRGAANSSLDKALSTMGEFGESAPSGPSGGGRGAFSKAALIKLWRRAGGDPSYGNLMAAIALAESGGRPTAHNPSGASGLWQILGLPFPGDPFDPLTNARMAVSKLGSQGLGAWEVYTKGTYRQFLQKGGMAGMANGGPVGLFDTLHKLGKSKSKHIRSAATGKMIDRIKAAGLSGGLQKHLNEYSKNADVYADYADRAGTLGAPVNGSTQAEWLAKELEALFKWRNALIRAHEQVVERRGKIAQALALAVWSRKSLKKRIDVLSKHPKKNGALLRPLNAQYNGLGKLIPALSDKRSGLNTLRGSLLSSLEDVQGVAAPSGILKKLPAVGVLGGRIFDVQSSLRDLNAPAESVTDSGGGDSESASLLSELLRQANLRTAVSEAQFKVFQNAPQFGGGGIVPGSGGQAVPAVVHAGEGVFTRDQMAAMGGTGPSVTINVAPGMEWLKQFITVTVDQNTRRQSRGGNRPLPGRGGGITR